jgi:hypothetical protein
MKTLIEKLKALVYTMLVVVSIVLNGLYGCHYLDYLVFFIIRNLVDIELYTLLD